MSNFKKNALGHLLSRKSINHLYHLGENSNEKDDCHRILKKYAPLPDKAKIEPLEVRYPKIAFPNFKHNCPPFRPGGSNTRNRTTEVNLDLSKKSVYFSREIIVPSFIDSKKTGNPIHSNFESLTFSENVLTSKLFDHPTQKDKYDGSTSQSLIQNEQPDYKSVSEERIRIEFIFSSIKIDSLLSCIYHCLFKDSEHSENIGNLGSVNDSYEALIGTYVRLDAHYNTSAFSTDNLIQRLRKNLSWKYYEDYNPIIFTEKLVKYDDDPIVKSMKEKPFT